MAITNPPQREVTPIKAEVSPTTAAPRGRQRWPVIALVVLVIAAAVTTWYLLGRGDGADPVAAPVQLNFAEVIIADLVETETLDGTLGYTDGEPISTRVPGTVTAVAADGDVVEAGDVLYEVDGDPVVLMYGAVPAWRTLELESDGEPVSSRLNGTITAIYAEETVATEGDLLFAVDGEPVTLLLGDLPAWRTLNRRSSEGADVAQLEAALVRLGFDAGEDLTVDEDFTSFTEDLVQDWQESIGATDDGVVNLGEVVFLPEPVDIGEALLDVGDVVRDGDPVLATISFEDAPSGSDVRQLEENLASFGFDAGGALVVDGVFDQATHDAVTAWQETIGAEVDGIVELGEVVFLPGPVRITDGPAVGATLRDGDIVYSTSSSQTLVRVDLAAADQDLVEVGDSVTIVLPDNRETGGTVTSVGSVATTNQAGDSTFEVEIVLDDPSAAGRLDEAPVEVDVVSDSARNVMAVPVTALIALAEGGYAVEVERGSGQTALVAVQPGFFAGGLVEVESSGLAVGDRVVVP